MKVLLFTDFVAFGNIGGGQVAKILSYAGMEIFCLPTSLISNMFSLESNCIKDTSDFCQESLKNRSKMGLVFDAIFIGHLNNPKQKELILTYLKGLEKKPIIFLDPIMGDKGKLYKSVDGEIVSSYKELLKVTNFLICNRTEAGLLTDRKDFPIQEILEALSDTSPIITSVKDPGGKSLVYGRKREGGLVKVPFERIEKNFIGTGDIFDGLFMADYLKNFDFEGGIKRSVKNISTLLEENYRLGEGADLALEKYLNLIEI